MGWWPDFETRVNAILDQYGIGVNYMDEPQIKYPHEFQQPRIIGGRSCGYCGKLELDPHHETLMKAAAGLPGEITKAFPALDKKSVQLLIAAALIELSSQVAASNPGNHTRDILATWVNMAIVKSNDQSMLPPLETTLDS